MILVLFFLIFVFHAKVPLLQLVKHINPGLTILIKKVSHREIHSGLLVDTRTFVVELFWVA